MYLFTLIFIFLTVIGVFTEVLTLQNNRLATKQTIGASSMLTWHGAVLGAARYSVAGAPAFPTWGTILNPCTVLATGAPAANANAPACLDNGAVPANALLEALIVAPGPTTVTALLPAQFAARYQSLIFTTNNVRLAVTFINPGANASDPLPPTGLTASEINRQLKRLGVDLASYGYIAGGQLQPMLAPNAAISGAYTIPPALLAGGGGPIQNGAIALFTPL